MMILAVALVKYILAIGEIDMKEKYQKDCIIEQNPVQTITYPPSEEMNQNEKLLIINRRQNIQMHGKCGVTYAVRNDEGNFIIIETE